MYSESMHINDIAITDIDSYYDDEIYEDSNDSFWDDYYEFSEDTYDKELDDEINDPCF